jgi:hypothetical protein
MKIYIKILLGLFFVPILTNGQNLNYDNIINNWTEGRIENNNNVLPLSEPRRGGYYSLTLKNDSSIIFNYPLDCGVDYKLIGKWNTIDSLLICKFERKITYISNKETEISEIMKFRILKLTPNNLILKDLNTNKILPYRKK